MKQTESGATVRWHSNAVSLRIDPSMQRYFNRMAVRDMVEDAAFAWGGLPGVPELLISEGVPGPQGFDSKRGTDNGVYLVEDWKLAESSLAVTVATFETKSGKIVDTDILVNPNHPLAVLATEPEAPVEEPDAPVKEPDGPAKKPDTPVKEPDAHAKERDAHATEFDIAGVMTHEMGHVLGLGESYDVRMATMWPNVARGEIHQRDLHEDDETGAETAYAQAIAAESATSSGCGGASVMVRRGQGASPIVWLAMGGALIAAGLWLRSRTRQQRRRGAPMLALVVLFGSPFRGESSGDASQVRVEVLRTLALRRQPDAERSAGLAVAARSRSSQVRMAAAAVLERSGLREELAIASDLATDPDPEVRRIGRLAVERLRTAPPARRVAASSDEARKRLKSLLGDTGEVVQGEAVRMGASVEQGLVWSRYLVHGENEVVEVQIPGGSIGELTQVVSEQEAPLDGSQVVVAKRARGPHAWAHLRDGVVYGGFLGDGPAIEWRKPR